MVNSPFSQGTAFQSMPGACRNLSLIHSTNLSVFLSAVRSSGYPLPNTRSKMTTLAAFKLPNIQNEPNVSPKAFRVMKPRMMLILAQKHYEKRSAEREGLTAAIEAFQRRAPLDIPLVLGGKSVRSKTPCAINRTLLIASSRSQPPTF